jgi:hypothetical protein
MNNLDEQLWKFARGDTPSLQFELWLYSLPELETFLGSDLYLELISFNFKNEKAVSELRYRIKFWLDNNISRSCDCITWHDREKIPLGSDNINLLDNFQTLKERTPWLELMCCLNCGQYWYVAIDSVDDDYYLLRLDKEISLEILEKDNWPTCFDSNKNFWPDQKWLERAGYNSLQDWQDHNNRTNTG